MSKRHAIPKEPPPFRMYRAHCAHCGRLLRPPHDPRGPEYCPDHQTPEGRTRCAEHRPVGCPACAGTGIDPDGEHFEGSWSHYCPQCKGTGRLP